MQSNFDSEPNDDKLALYADLLESIDVGISVFDDQLRLIVWNQAFLELLDIPADFVKMHKPYLDFVEFNIERGEFGDRDREEIIKERLEVAYQTKANEYVRVRPNGKVLRVGNRPSPRGGFVSTYTDISRQTDVENGLRQSQEEFRTLAEIGSDWFWQTDKDHKFVTYSGYREITGLPKEGATGVCRWENASARDLEDTEKWERHKAQLAAGEKFRDFEFELKSDPPEWIRVSGDPICGDDGTFLGYRGIAVIITDRKHNQQELERLITAFDSMSESVAVFDAEDRFVFCNRHYRELNKKVIESLDLGTPFVAHLRAIVSAGLVPEAVGKEEEWIANRLKRHQNPSGPFQLQRQDGLYLQVYEQHLDQGGLIVLVSDITELKHVQIKLTNALTAAERASQAKSKFLATMSHEFRTPLNAILGFSEMLSEQYYGPLGSTNYLGYAKDIHTSGAHMLALVDDVLDISAIEAGKRVFRKSEIEVPLILAECLKKVENDAAAKNITLTRDVQADLPELVADERSVVQIILNLLSNALKFTAGDGEIIVSAAKTGGDIVIAVKDNGSGIPHDKLPTISDPFTQVNANPHQTQEGSGLGLSIVRSLIEAHDGTLSISSTVGQGTVVSVALPLGQEKTD